MDKSILKFVRKRISFGIAHQLQKRRSEVKGSHYSILMHVIKLPFGAEQQTNKVKENKECENRLSTDF